MKHIELILKAMGYTFEQYENMLIRNYFDWCISGSCGPKLLIQHATNLISPEEMCDVQKLMANGALFNWFCSEVEKLERDFLEDYGPYMENAEAHISDARMLYCKHAIKVFGVYSKPLKAEAIKLNIVGHE